MFLSSYGNTSEGLGEQEMLWEHKPQAQPIEKYKTFSMFLSIYRNTVIKQSACVFSLSYFLIINVNR